MLASASPRRRDLLSAAGFTFDVAAVHVDERRLPGESPGTYVERVARLKALAAATQYPAHIVIGADTAVVVDDATLGKPVDAADAARMLRLISGRAHDVLTGVAVACRGAVASSVTRTRVWVDTLSEADVIEYVASGEPMDKAGAYAIQGWASRFIPKIEGSYDSVVGLPVAGLLQLLKQVWVCTGERTAPEVEQVGRGRG